MWDTAGSEAYRSLGKMFYRDVDAVLVCYKKEDRASFDNVKVWLKDLENHVGFDVDIVKYLVSL